MTDFELPACFYLGRRHQPESGANAPELTKKAQVTMRAVVFAWVPV